MNKHLVALVELLTLVELLGICCKLKFGNNDRHNEPNINRMKRGNASAQHTLWMIAVREAS